jgi:hypothetical protein
MEDFDIQLSMNGTQNELTDNSVDLSFYNKKQDYLNFEGEKEDVKEKETTPWTDTLNTLTKEFKQITGFKTNDQLQKEKEKELAEKGTKYKILGMNPFVAIALSLVVIIGGSVAITKIK